MAMLAEKRYKTKYILNPKCNDWSKDESKFGQKMLEKMGWSKGKGLGANMDGMVDHVKVSYKNDSRGMGFKDNGEQWTQHEDQFAALLKELNNSEDAVQPKPEESKLNLEERSKKSKKRVHYHKFTRGKDLSRYSQKDLANIFGRSTLEKKVIKEDVVEDEIKEEVANENLKNSGSMADYFKMKMANSGLDKKINIKKEIESDSEEELGTIGFGFSAPNKKECESNSNFDFSKKGLYKGFVSTSIKQEDTSDIKEEPIENIDCSKNALYKGFVSSLEPKPENMEEVSKKKKKKRKLVEDSSEAVSKVKDETIVESACDSNEKKKKKKKKHSDENNVVEQNISNALETDCSQNKKKKKKKKNKEL